MRNSRRARLVLVVLLLVALTLITIDFRSGSSGSLRSIGSSIFGPIENAVSAVFRPVGSWFSGLAHLSSYKSENDQLRSEVQQLRNQLAQTAADERAYQQLQQLDGLANKAGWKIVPAHVTSVTAGGLGMQWTAAIDRGSVDGIRPEETVITGAGLLGKTIQVSRTSATVLLAIDPNFYAGCYLQANGEEAKVSGDGLSPMQLTLLDPQQPVRPGQRIVTAGDPRNHDHPFVPQVPIGTVSSVENGTTATGGRIARVKPFVNFTGLGGASVGVVTVATKQIRYGALLPPKPTSTGSPASSGASPGGSPGRATPSSPQGPSTPVTPTPASTAPMTKPT